MLEQLRHIASALIHWMVLQSRHTLTVTMHVMEMKNSSVVTVLGPKYQHMNCVSLLSNEKTVTCFKF